MVLTTSAKADEFLTELANEAVEVPTDAVTELLLLCQTEYVVLPDPCTFAEMLQAVRTVSRTCDGAVEVSATAFRMAFVEGFLAVKLVVWS